MALVTCKECGKEISNKADACPHCGAKPKRTGCFTWIIAGVCALIVIGVIGNMMNPAAPTPEAAKTPPAQKTPEQIARDNGVARASVAAKAIHEAARNPESFVLDLALVMPDGTACLEYRAQNGFGGFNREQAVAPDGADKIYSTGANGFRTAWNKHCAGKSGSDVTYQVRQYMKLI